jgi:hypothetical protein
LHDSDQRACSLCYVLDVTLLPCAWLGCSIQPGWVEPVFRVFACGAVGDGFDPGANTRLRCGSTPSAEIWRTERTHPGSVASIFSLSLLPSMRAMASDAAACCGWMAAPPLRPKPLRPSAPAEAPPLDARADRPPPHAGRGPSAVALRVQASGLDLQADEQQFCVGRGAVGADPAGAGLLAAGSRRDARRRSCARYRRKQSQKMIRSFFQGS